jgi:hypothetical protein
MGALTALLMVTACSTTATDSGQKALHYEGGATQAEKFVECINPGERVVDGSGDKHYTYPMNQRKYVFDITEGADREPLTVTTKDGITQQVTGITNFVLNTSCEPLEVEGKKYEGGALQVFHEFLGKPRNAYFDDNTEGSGWLPILNDYIGRQLQILANSVAQENNWTYEQLYNDATVREQWQKQVQERLAVAVNRGMETNVEFFKNYVVSFDQPEPPQEIKQSLLARQTAKAKAETAGANAEAQRLAAEAQEDVAKAEAAVRQSEIKGYGSVEAYLCAKHIEAGLSCFPPGADSFILSNPSSK